MSEDKRNKRGGSKEHMERMRQAKARKAQANRWQPPAIREASPEVRERMAKIDAERVERQRLETIWLRRARGEDVELEEQGHPPSSSPLPGMATPHPIGPGGGTDFAAIVAAPPTGETSTMVDPAAPRQEQPQQQPHHVVLGGHDPEQDPHLRAAGGDELRRRLVAEELERQRAELQRKREQASAAPAGTGGPVRPGGYRQGRYQRPELGKTTVEAGAVPSRQNPPPAPPATAPIATTTTGVASVIASHCTCGSRSMALTLFGAQEKEKIHLNLSADCRRWAAERGHADTFTRSVEQVSTEEYTKLSKVEPVPPPPVPVIRPRRHGRIADVLPSFRGNFSPEPGPELEFPSSTISSKEEFFENADD